MLGRKERNQLELFITGSPRRAGAAGNVLLVALCSTSCTSVSLCVSRKLRYCH